MKEKYIEDIKKLELDQEYTINWIEESGALITRVQDGYRLEDVSYGNTVSDAFFFESEIKIMVEEAMTYI